MSRCCNHTTLLFRSYNCFLLSLLLTRLLCWSWKKTDSQHPLHASKAVRPTLKRKQRMDVTNDKKKNLRMWMQHRLLKHFYFPLSTDKLFANTESVPSLLQFVWTCWTWSVEVFPLQRRSRRPWYWTGPGRDTQAGTNTVYTFLRMVDTVIFNKWGSLKIPDQ